MPVKEKPKDISFYIEIILRRRWFIILPFCLCMIVGIWLAISMPRVYESQTLILVEPQRVPTEYVQSVISADVDSRINTISEQIMSRTNLESIIKEFDLFSGPKAKDAFIEDKIENLRNRINIRVVESRRKGAPDAVTISFKGRHPKNVMKVANSLAQCFINENLKVREAQAIGTSNFLDDELNTMRVRLEEVEEKLKDYRKRYMGQLPEQLETNLRILDRLQQQLNEKQDNLRDARARLLEANRLLSELQDSGLADGTGPSPAGDFSNLVQARNRLAELKARYKDRHPDVIRLKEVIAELEQKVKTGGSQSNDGATSSSIPLTDLYGTGIPQPRLIEREIAGLREDIAQLQRQIDSYEKRVEAAPRREQELLSLRRDHENIQNTYNSLLNRKLEAEIAVNMERKQKGEQFRIVDPAKLPERPVEPDLKRLFLFSVAAGLGIGVGLVFLLEYFNTSFRDPEDVEEYIGIPVIAAVPTLYQPKDVLLHRLNSITTIVGIVIALLLSVGFATLILNGNH